MSQIKSLAKSQMSKHIQKKLIKKPQIALGSANLNAKNGGAQQRKIGVATAKRMKEKTEK